MKGEKNENREQAFDGDKLAKRIPGRSKNDCIQFFKSTLGDFEWEGADPGPFDESAAPVFRTESRKGKDFDSYGNSSIETELEKCREVLKRVKLELEAEKRKKNARWHGHSASPSTNQDRWIEPVKVLTLATEHREYLR